MNEGHEITAASAAAVEAAKQGEQFALMLSAIQAAQAQQHAGGCGCQHTQPPARTHRSTGQMLAIAGAVCACGAVAVGMFLAIAVTALAVAGGSVVLLLLVRELRTNQNQQKR
ncbi:hypothetical protein ACH4E8_22865 [Streptomyces sp. NPDC017979]|uniref:hypothetical protein n=1 Tax=Streptomyces sp. NPDC017979 TaxID=3365024 RepID=UPI0037AE349F